MKVNIGTRLRNERGAVLYLVAISMVAFLGIAAMAIDYGMWFVGRSEAQRAAEAGAHAGASILRFSSDESRAREEAELFAERNAVRGVTLDVLPDEDIDVLLDSQKVRVRVQRSTERGNPVATVFARAMGIDDVDIGAVAAAQAWPGVSSDCILPFAIPDRWEEYDPSIPGYRPSQIGDVFDADIDIYVPGPTGTGYAAQDVGEQFQLTTADPSQTPQPEWYYSIALPGTQGANDYRTAIRECWTPSGEHQLGDEVDKEPGNMTGPTRQGFGDIFNDPDEQDQYWDTTMECPVRASDPNNCLTQSSRRIRPLVMFDPREWDNIANGRKPVPITNFAGVWLESWDGNNSVTVRWMAYTAIKPANNWEDSAGSLLQVIRIVE